MLTVIHLRLAITTTDDTRAHLGLARRHVRVALLCHVRCAFTHVLLRVAVPESARRALLMVVPRAEQVLVLVRADVHGGVGQLVLHC